MRKIWAIYWYQNLKKVEVNLAVKKVIWSSTFKYDSTSVTKISICYKSEGMRQWIRTSTFKHTNHLLILFIRKSIKWLMTNWFTLPSMLQYKNSSCSDRVNLRTFWTDQLSDHQCDLTLGRQWFTINFTFKFKGIFNIILFHKNRLQMLCILFLFITCVTYM